MHTVCAVVTEEFLRFSVGVRNDLVTPRFFVGFQGLRPVIAGVCARAGGRRRHRAGVTPPVLLPRALEAWE